MNESEEFEVDNNVNNFQDFKHQRDNSNAVNGPQYPNVLEHTNELDYTANYQDHSMIYMDRSQSDVINQSNKKLVDHNQNSLIYGQPPVIINKSKRNHPQNEEIALPYSNHQQKNENMHSQESRQSRNKRKRQSKITSIQEMEFDVKGSSDNEQVQKTNRTKNSVLSQNSKRGKTQQTLRKNDNKSDEDSLPLYKSTDFIDQQLAIHIDSAQYHGKIVFCLTFILFIFPILHLTYQLYLLITINTQVQVMADKEDNEGKVINMEVSMPLYIVSMIFGIIANSVIFIIGYKGYKTLRNSLRQLKALEYRQTKNKIETQQEQINDLYTFSLISVFAIVLLVVIQIGLNFITIQKAQSDFVQAHRSEHKKPNEIISYEEKQTLEILRGAYQYSYVGLAALQILFFTLYLTQFAKFKKYQQISENTVLSINAFKYKVKGKQSNKFEDYIMDEDTIDDIEMSSNSARINKLKKSKRNELKANQELE
eukprot:403369604